jgi:hypothetical protein
MLRTMRSPGGGPSMRVRMVALVLMILMLAAGGAAPVLIPVTRWVFGQILF